ncbi:hypothetical protein AQUSIP_22570 [Aquicella siphonis]|uniref:Uncharacterized protein n=1 Tax=Aquicella siphonis TaxID=254247 RepID=A0A5E4PIN5_9COXI|nr:hypothetical protein [Aquicella siphonis]VVC76930.1 hypothetical protein AQUSIP_22570 [Aquicella siphonis]
MQRLSGNPAAKRREEEQDRYQIQKNRFKDEVLLRLSSIEGVNQCLEERRCVFLNGKPINFSQCQEYNVFLENGDLNPEAEAMGITLELSRNKAFLQSLFISQDLGRLTLRERIILEAVLFSVQFQFYIESQRHLMDEQGRISEALAKDQDNKELQRAIERVALELQSAQEKAAQLTHDTLHTLPISSMQAALLSNPGIHPQAAAAQSLIEYIAYLQRAGIWSFYVPPAPISLQHAYSRTFNDIPLPPYLSPLMAEMSLIMQRPEHLEENLAVWFKQAVQYALAELFDTKGHIRESLFKLLPHTGFPLQADDENLKITLLQAYLASVITENISSVLDKAENREAANRLMTETRDLGDGDTEIVRTQMRDFITRKLQYFNVGVGSFNTIDEVRENMSTASRSYQIAPARGQASSSRHGASSLGASGSDSSGEENDDEQTPFLSGGEPPRRNDESVPRRSQNKPGIFRRAWNSVADFFGRHWKAITATTVSFAIAGGLGGAGVGLAAGVFGAIPTGGLSILATPFAIAILGGAGFVAGAVVGFTFGVIGSLVMDAVTKSSPRSSSDLTIDTDEEQLSPSSTRKIFGTTSPSPRRASENSASIDYSAHGSADLYRKKSAQKKEGVDSRKGFTKHF